jgi:vacuolar-type H+-ATPase subunit E/Vma4
MDRDSRLTIELTPLEATLLAVAREQAAARVKAAEAQAAATKEDTDSRAKALLDQAATEGKVAAERAAKRYVVQATRQARTLVLAAERAAYERLVTDAVSVVRALRDRPEYADLEQHLVDTAKAVLGTEAQVVRLTDEGGVHARSGGRSVDLTLAGLARRCVERLGDRVTRLWS